MSSVLSVVGEWVLFLFAMGLIGIGVFLVGCIPSAWESFVDWVAVSFARDHVRRLRQADREEFSALDEAIWMARR